MMLEDKIFNGTTVHSDRLLAYGFKLVDDKYTIEKSFMGGDFRAVISITKQGIVHGTVYDVASDDIYMPLRVEEMAAGFAGQVREAYIAILEDIKAHCFSKCAFSGHQANRLADEIFALFGDTPLFPWDKYDGYGVFKNPKNDKWYALIMNIDKSKLDKKLQGNIDVINLKLDKNEIQALLKCEGFYPAYHMNKKSWITITLDDTVDDEKIMSLIEKSHYFTLGKRGKYKGNHQAWLVPANPKYFDIIKAFQQNEEIIWKQSAKIKADDIVYMYVGAPYSAVLYQCIVTEADIDYDYQDKNLKISKVMRIKKLQQFDENLLTFRVLNGLGVRAIRGPRDCPQEVIQWLKDKING